MKVIPTRASRAEDLEEERADMVEEETEMDRLFGPPDCCGTWPEVCEFHHGAEGLHTGSSAATDQACTAAEVAS